MLEKYKIKGRGGDGMKGDLPRTRKVGWRKCHSVRRAEGNKKKRKTEERKDKYFRGRHRGRRLEETPKMRLRMREDETEGRNLCGTWGGESYMARLRADGTKTHSSAHHPPPPPSV